MTIDVQSLRGTLKQLREDVAVLHRRVEAAERQLADATPADIGVQLPPEIVVPRPAAVAAFLSGRPAFAQIVFEMAHALLNEFEGESSQILLSLDQDEHVDAHYLTFTVRLPEYSIESNLIDRLDSVSVPFDERLSSADGWVVATTDFVPSERV